MGAHLTEDQKEKMRAGRKAAAERKNAAAAAAQEPEHLAPSPELPEVPVIREPEPESPLLSDGELERIREEAKKKVDAELAALNVEKKKAKMAEALDAEVLQMRRDAGLTDYRDDVVEIFIDVAPFSDNLTIDGTVYQHGQWYKVSRRKADSMREAMARSWDSEDRAGNPNRKFRREAGAPMNSMLLERKTADGAYTMGGAPMVNGKTGAVSGIREIA